MRRGPTAASPGRCLAGRMQRSFVANRCTIRCWKGHKAGGSASVPGPCNVSDGQVAVAGATCMRISRELCLRGRRQHFAKSTLWTAL